MSRKFIFMVLILISCTSDLDLVPQEFLNDPAFYFGESNTVTLNVFYEPGAEPFTGDVGASVFPFTKIWDLTYLNLEEIFSFKSVQTQINVPRELNEMTFLEPFNKDTWTVDDIIDLARDQGIRSKNGNEAIFSVFFVRGFFSDSSGVRNNVVGVNVSGTSITLIFKDVINSMPAILRVFSEQATVVHEAGHALGFVNNGVPQTGAHFDGLNGAHSNEEECIMYHLNEGAEDLSDFIMNLNSTGDATLWGPGVLSDVQAFSK